MHNPQQEDDRSNETVQRDRMEGDIEDTPRLRLWPGAIFVLLGGHVLLMLVMVYWATSDRSFAVEPDYYQKAMHWDADAAQRRASDRLGWSVDIAVSDAVDIYKNRDVTCAVMDQAGHPVSGALVEMVVFSHARGNDRTAITLDPIGLGQYKARLRMPRSGLWEFRIMIERNSDRFVQVQQVRVAAARGAR